MSQSPVPPNDPDLARWALTFGAKFPNHAATLGFSAGEVAAVQADAAYLVYLIQVRLPAEKSTLAATVEFKEFMKTGDAGAAIPTPLPGVSSPPPYPEPVPPPGIVFRLRKLVQNIKSRPRYTEVIGRDLGIIVGKGTDAPEAPVLALISAVAGGVTLGWNKGGRTGVKLQARRGDGAWSDLGVDLFSPYVDERPLAVPGQPETREYRACYLDGDTALPVFSAVLQVTATP